jgi:undecaprenyl-diphosphatase
MNIIELIKGWDTSLFFMINGHFTPFLDNVMFTVSDKFIWIPLYLSVLYVLIKNWKKEAIVLIIALILCIVISDQLASGVLKHMVKRLRPSHVENLSNIVHLVKGYAGGLYGFASSHASNAFGFALLSALIIRRKVYTWAIFFWAVLMAYSRIYLGVHYPLDVFGGAAVGTLSALLCFWCLKKLKPEILKSEHFEIYKGEEILLISVLIISFLGIITYSFFI